MDLNELRQQMEMQRRSQQFDERQQALARDRAAAARAAAARQSMAGMARRNILQNAGGHLNDDQIKQQINNARYLYASGQVGPGQKAVKLSGDNDWRQSYNNVRNAEANNLNAMQNARRKARNAYELYMQRTQGRW